ncbi:MAG: DNA polymerase III subunit gamma/tau [Campylobacterota bacterium]|nr:DNA polymerase III subunit gamma/tau [Campylobacterota bacterium]
MKASSEVLARKYRPESFDELIGQETISQTLSLALDSKRLSHAYLLSGLRGSGKTSTARIFAKALVCEHGPTSKPCGACEHCLMAKESRHMDIIEMDAASSRKIDDIRDLIEHTKYKPSSAQFKIFIIDEVHMLTKEAFNALLKTLEEPPAYVKFILATTDPLKLPATILSRTQHFRFKKISSQNIVHHLAHILQLEGIEYQNEALEILARSGSGSLRDTLTLLDQAIIYSKNFVDVKTVTDMLGLIDPEFIAAIFKAVFSKDYAQLVAFTKELEDYEAEMVVDELIAYLKERLYAKDPLFSTLILERFFRILSDAKSLFAINADGTFVLSLIFFKMVEALRVKEIDQMIESLEREVKRPSSISIPEPVMAPPVETPSARDQDETPVESSPPIPMTEAPVEEVPLPSTNQSVAADIPTEPVETTTAMEEPEPLQQTVPTRSEGEINFKALCEQISDRNAELGECFSNQVYFTSYENGVLTWESCADESCKQQLRHGYSVIKQFVREIYGFDTQIKHLPCSRQIESSPQTEEREDFAGKSEGGETPSSMNDPQPASMTEEVETGSGSCVTGCDTNDEVATEFDGNSILEEPMILKAKELFEATKITIQSKV